MACASTLDMFLADESLARRLAEEFLARRYRTILDGAWTAAEGD